MRRLLAPARHQCLTGNRGENRLTIRSRRRDRIAKYRERVQMWADRADKFREEDRPQELADAEWQTEKAARLLVRAVADYVEELAKDRLRRLRGEYGEGVIMDLETWCKEHGCTHSHCPNECSKPQPIVLPDGRCLCGCCLVIHGEEVEMVPCVPATCGE